MRLHLVLSTIILITIAIQPAEAQSSISLRRDTISPSNAQLAQTRFRNDLGNCSKKSTSFVNFDVGQLNDIIQQCRLNSITNVQMVIVTLQARDTAHYVVHHAGLSTSERNDLIGRQPVLIKVPRSAFSGVSQSGAFQQKENPLMLSMLASGLMKIEKPYGQMPNDDYIYFEIGSICPPPSICN